MTFADGYNLRQASGANFNAVANAIDGTIKCTWGGTTTGTATAYAVSPSPAWDSTTRAEIRFIVLIPHVTNTGSATLAVSALAAADIRKNNVALSNGELRISCPTMLVWDGTYYQIIDPVGSLNIQGTSQNSLFTEFSASISPSEISFQKSRGSTVGTNTIVQDGDTLGRINFRGANGTSFDNGAQIDGVVSGTPGTSADMPTALVFRTSGDGSATPTERVRITPAGKVGVANGSPSNNLEVGDGTANVNIGVNGLDSGSSGGGYVVVKNNGSSKVAIGNYSGILGGTYDSTATLWSGTSSWKVSGLATGAGTWPMKFNTTTLAWTYDTSRRSSKENIRDSSYGLGAALLLRPRQFNYLASEQHREDVGFIADEVFQVIPELAPCDENGEPAGVSYDRLTAVLCKAVQELNAKIEALEARIAALEA